MTVRRRYKSLLSFQTNSLRTLCSAVILLGLLASLCAQASESALTTAQGLQPVRAYISSAWDTLTRSMARCDSVVDPKVPTSAVLYLPAGFARPASLDKLQSECRVRIEHLPVPIERPGQPELITIDSPGLLFLENSYVVPGGRFNEMYGWDSYFIIVGLLRDGRTEMARGMVENFFFEIEHYGTVLNANRTYYLTRSQPPFLTSMILGVYEAEKSAGHADRAWLEKAYKYASKDHELWTREPHRAGDTGLARYFDFGQGPVAEGLQDESGFYRGVTRYFLSHPNEADRDLLELKTSANNPEAIGFKFSLQLCEATQMGETCDRYRTLSLSRDYYKGDRSMRESGFDVSFRFGPFGAQTHHYAPVCLNSLLYKYEKDLEAISRMLGKQSDAERWAQLAQDRKQRVYKYLWDPQQGTFVDYDFEAARKSSYEYITMFYPLWAGLATPEQARAVIQHLTRFEQPGGLAMSHNESGAQWDYPYGWAPTNMLAIQGIRRYGFGADADRLSYKFLSMILENFRHDGTIREKYNVVTRSSETTVTAGYRANVVGFGWTNAAFLELLQAMPQELVNKLARQSDGAPVSAP